MPKSPRPPRGEREEKKDEEENDEEEEAKGGGSSGRRSSSRRAWALSASPSFSCSPFPSFFLSPARAVAKVIIPASVTRGAPLIVRETSRGRRRAAEEEESVSPRLPHDDASSDLALLFKVAAIFANPTSVSPAAAQNSSSRSMGGAARAAATSSAGVDGSDDEEEGHGAVAEEEEEEEGDKGPRSAFSSAERGRVPSSFSPSPSSFSAAAFSAATRTASAAEKTTASATDSGTAGRADATEVSRIRRAATGSEANGEAVAAATAAAPKEEGKPSAATSAAVGGLALRRSSERSDGNVSRASSTSGCSGERCVQRSVVAWAHELLLLRGGEGKKEGQRGGASERASLVGGEEKRASTFSDGGHKLLERASLCLLLFIFASC